MYGRVVDIIYILRGAFSVARFDISGNARAFIEWNEQAGWLHVFIMYANEPNTINICHEEPGVE